MNQIVCDLVLLSWNQLQQTRACIESLFETTDIPTRLLIVDNGSEPEARAALAEVKPRGAVQEVVLLQNETNEGFPRGMNRGMNASTAPFVCLLNNDLIFTKGWLSQMLRVMEAHPEIGLLNPTSNNFGNIPPEGMSNEAYAESLRSFEGEYVEVGMCIGFCFLIRRDVLNRIGPLTEEVERIFFEDEDFCMRAQEADFRCGVACGSYVIHAEHQTVKHMPEREALFDRNQQWCQKRWGRRVRIAWPRFSAPHLNSRELHDWLSQLIAWARRRSHVYIYCPLPEGTSPAELFRSVGLVPHADVSWRNIPEKLPRLGALGRIVKRQKKRFDIIVAPDEKWAEMIHNLGWIHRAKVVPEADPANLRLAWQLASRYPS